MEYAVPVSGVNSTLLLIFLLSGCSTYEVGLFYTGTPEATSAVSAKIGEIVVQDNRGTDDNWLGAVRGGFGNKLKSLRTSVPTRQTVEFVYRSALSRYGYLDEQEGRIRLAVNIEKLDCNWYYHREAHAHLAISLIERDTSEIIFYGRYRSDPREAGPTAIFSPGQVGPLQKIVQRALNQAVDKSLTDVALVAALSRLDNTPEMNSVEKLRQLKELHDQGLITDEEYSVERQEALDSM